jgi:hypothetical protein
MPDVRVFTARCTQITLLLSLDVRISIARCTHQRERKLEHRQMYALSALKASPDVRNAAKIAFRPYETHINWELIARCTQTGIARCTHFCPHYRQMYAFPGIPRPVFHNHPA